MTTISLAEVFTVTLDDHKLMMTPTMGLMRRVGIVEDMAASEGPTDGIVLGQTLFDAYKEGTKRHRKWAEVEPILEDYTFQELFTALREGMMARLGELMEAQSLSP